MTRQWAGPFRPRFARGSARSRTVRLCRSELYVVPLDQIRFRDRGVSINRYAEGLELIGGEMSANGAIPVRQVDRGTRASTAGFEAPQNEIVAVLGALDHRDNDGVGVDTNV